MLKIIEAMCESKLKFPGGGGDAKQETFHGEIQIFFWSCAIANTGM